jgi:CheY-like chemotaxis protein
MESIERSAKVQTQLISDLMELSRIRMGKLRIEVQPVCLSEVVQSAIQTVVPAAKAKGIQVDSPQQSSVGPVLADPDRIHQIVWNLLSNAIKFTPSGGSVRAFVIDKRDQAELLVTDTGEGIDPSFLPLVFQRFQQGTGKPHQGGLGLGLSIVKELVELHGGTIEAASGGKGRGSEFKVILPKLYMHAVAKEDSSAQSPRASSSSNALEGKRILIVDDDLEARALVESVLSREGAETIAAASAVEAQRHLGTFRPNVLISDLGMPDVDGFELIKAVRRPGVSIAALPAIALTAYTSERDQSRAIESGFQIHLGKPVEPQVLVDAVVGLAEAS